MSSLFVTSTTKLFDSNEIYYDINNGHGNLSVNDVGSNIDLDDEIKAYLLLSKKLTLNNWATNILEYYSMIVIVLGNLFNIINFACFYRIKKRNSQNVYLSVLSLAELFNVNINILVSILRHKSKAFNELLVKNTYLCVLEGYLCEIGLLLPVWIMVALTAERFVSIQWPLRKTTCCTPKHAKILLTILTIVICLLSLYKLETAGVENKSTFHDNSCRNVTLPFLVNTSTVMWAFVPELLTLVLNILIIQTIKTTTHTNKRFYSSHRIRRFNQATRLVVMLSIIFIALISPTGILIIIEIILSTRYINSGSNGSSMNGISDYVVDSIPNQNLTYFSLKNDSFIKTSALYQDTHTSAPLYSDYLVLKIDLLIARKFALILYETNLIVNFPIYLMIFKNFRESLKNLIPKFNLLKRSSSDKIGHRHEQKRFIEAKINNKLKPKINIKIQEKTQTIMPTSRKYRLACDRGKILLNNKLKDVNIRASLNNKALPTNAATTTIIKNNMKIFKYNHEKKITYKKKHNGEHFSLREITRIEFEKDTNTL